MKKFLIALAAGVILFGGQTEAAPVDDLNTQLETQDIKPQGKWAHFRDKYLLGRETENERRDRKDWERRHHYDPPPPPPRYSDRDRYGPPPPRYRDDGRYYPPGAPPPPPPYRDGRRYYPPPTPPPPPPRYRR